ELEKLAGFEETLGKIQSLTEASTSAIDRISEIMNGIFTEIQPFKEQYDEIESEKNGKYFFNAINLNIFLAMEYKMKNFQEAQEYINSYTKMIEKLNE
ncbi:MAG: hypothetical protein MHPSP_001172, partial [Paramarteilia canceri]